MLWVKYCLGGRAIRESTGTTSGREARDFLKKREGAIAYGRPMPVRAGLDEAGIASRISIRSFVAVAWSISRSR